MKTVLVHTLHLNGGYSAGLLGDLINHGDDEAAQDAATLGYLSSPPTIVTAPTIHSLAESLVRRSMAATPCWDGTPCRFEVATAVRRFKALADHIEASDEDGITWIDLSRLSRPDREALVAILNRTTICEGHGELSDEDAAFLAAERDDGSEDAHREWIRANDRTD